MGMDGARLEGLRAAAVSIDAARALEAGESFHAYAPRRSAKRVLHFTQAAVLLALITALGFAVRADVGAVARVAIYLTSVLFAAVIAARLYAAASLGPFLSRLAEPAHWPIYTILCPLHREANVTADLVAALDRLDYPRHALDIKLLVEADDVDTIAVALAASTAPHVEVVIIAAAGPRTKPKALNIGLSCARGEYVVVYDAEDRPHPMQLRAALAAFEDDEDAHLACVQAPLVIDNASASWIARQFAAEYAIQFREILPLLARLGLPLPLGGSSNHFRADALKSSGGWDAYNVTEDADLGYRLARDGWRAGIIAPPTWEEAPVTYRSWLDQRTRWIKGHMHTWLVLMRNPFRTAHDLGLAPFLAMQLVLGGGFLAALAHGPLLLLVLVALISPQNVLGATGFSLAIGGYCVGLFSTLSAAALSGDVGHIRAAPTMPLYWPLQTIAALRAVRDLFLRPHHWAKTAHGVSARARFRFASQAQRVPHVDLAQQSA